VEYGFDNFKIGDDALINRFLIPIIDVVGVIDAVILMDTVSPATGTSNITIGATEYSNYAVARVGVTVV